MPPGALAPEEGTRGSARPGAAPFEAHRESTTGAPGASATKEVPESAALAGVKGGTLDVNGYVDAKVAEATAHLSHLAPSQLAAVQGVVREQLLADPHLRDLVQHVTGSAPPALPTEE